MEKCNASSIVSWCILLGILTMVYGQETVMQNNCGDSSIEGRWELDSIGTSLLYDSLQNIFDELDKPISIEFHKHGRFYGSNGCNGFFGKYVAYDSHLFCYDVGIQSGYCTYPKWQNEIHLLQERFCSGLREVEYVQNENRLKLSALFGELWFRKNFDIIGDKKEKTKPKSKKDMKDFNEAIDNIWKDNEPYKERRNTMEK